MLHIVVAVQAMLTDVSNAVSRRLSREDGAIAIEYVLIGVLVALAIITALTALGTRLGIRIDNIRTGLG
jgi:Flp pilus assembly pilin Flp